MEISSYGPIIPEPPPGSDATDWIFNLAKNTNPDMLKKSADNLRKIKGAFRRIMGLEKEPATGYDFDLFKRTVFRRWMVHPYVNYDARNKPSERDVDNGFHQQLVVTQFTSDCAYYANLDIPSDRQIEKGMEAE